MTENIHQGQPLLEIGPKKQDAFLIVIMLHGRGSTARNMASLAESLQLERVRFLIPQAAHNRWYPHSAFGPLEMNEPDLSSALRVIDALVKESTEDGFSNRQIVFGGFSQGACLAAEHVARNADRYGGLFVLSGALIGPQDQQRKYPGSLGGTPVFVGGSDDDPWITYDLLRGTAKVLEEMGAEVDFQTYSGMAHTINQDEIDRVRDILAKAIHAGAGTPVEE